MLKMDCRIDDCKQGVFVKSRQLCALHYHRWHRNGNPLTLKKVHRYLPRGAEYKIWTAMKNRCSNPKYHASYRYKERGITVCRRWLGADGYLNFINDMGKRPSEGYSIERIDNDKGYNPENCKWATAKEQANNRRPRIAHKLIASQ